MYLPSQVTTFKEATLVQLVERLGPGDAREPDTVFFYDRNNDGRLDATDLWFDCCTTAARTVGAGDLRRYGAIVGPLFRQAGEQRRQIAAQPQPAAAAGWCEAAIPQGSASRYGSFRHAFSLKSRREAERSRRYTAAELQRASFDPASCDAASASISVLLGGMLVQALILTGDSGTPPPLFLRALRQQADGAIPDLRYQYRFAPGIVATVQHVDVMDPAISPP